MSSKLVAIILLIWPALAVSAKYDLDQIGRSLNPNIASRGYLLGTISQAANRGKVFNTFEGGILLGDGSTLGTMFDADCSAEVQKNSKKKDFDKDLKDCEIGANPWRLSSFDRKLTKKLTQYPGVVLVRYYCHHYTMIVENDCILADAYPTNVTALPSKRSMTSQGLGLSKAVNYSKGFINGHIVKASLEGTVRLTYEIIIQAGDGGNKFFAMSVSNKPMFEFIVKAMATGRPLRVHYVHLFGFHAAPLSLLGYESDYRIFAVDIL